MDLGLAQKSTQDRVLFLEHEGPVFVGLVFMVGQQEGKKYDLT